MKTLYDIYEGLLAGQDTTLANGDDYAKIIRKAETALDELNAVCDNDGISFEKISDSTWRYYIVTPELFYAVNKQPKDKGNINVEIRRISQRDWTIKFEEIINGQRGQTLASANIKLTSATLSFKTLMKKLTKDKVFTSFESFKKVFEF